MWIVHGPLHRPDAKLAFFRQSDSLLGDGDILWHCFGTNCSALVHQSSYSGTAYPHERVQHPVVFVSHGEDQTLDQLDGELAGVDRLLDVVGLHIRNMPNITGILAQWVAGELANLLPFEVFLAGILLRDTDGIQVECVYVSLGK